MFDDVFVVVSEDWEGRRSERCVLAADEEDACQAHLVHYPDAQLVSIQRNT